MSNCKHCAISTDSDEQHISCKICSIKYHYSCLSKAKIIRNLNKNTTPGYIQNIFQSSNFPFICPQCLPNAFISDNSKIDTITKDIKSIKSICNSIKTTFVIDIDVDESNDKNQPSQNKLYSQSLFSDKLVKSITKTISNISKQDDNEIILTDNNINNKYINKSETISLFKSMGNLVKDYK